MRKTIHIHIGAHKTGTTAVQLFFAGNRAMLAERGLLYPAACEYLRGHHRLAFALQQSRRQINGEVPDFGAEIEGLKAEFDAAPCPAAFLSSEEFFALPPPRIGLLRQALSGYTVRIIAVLRRPDLLFESIFNQRTKMTTNRFCQPHTAFLDDPLALAGDLRFDRVLRNWSNAFGRENLAVYRYEERPNIVDSILPELGLTGDGLAIPDRRSNESVSVRAAEMIRHGKLAGLDGQALERLKAIGALRFPKESEEGRLLSPEERLDLLVRTDDMTDAVFDRYRLGPNLYHSRHAAREPQPPSVTFTMTDAMRLLADL